MATSGTVGQTVFQTYKLIDHALRRCRLAPQQITSEKIQTALELLWLRLSAMANKGITLFTLDRIILPMYEGVRDVPCPTGTVDVFDVNLRTVQRLEGTNSASEGDADFAFDGDIDTVCEQVAFDGWIQTQLDSATKVTTFGILPGASGTWSYRIQGSDDGITFDTLYTATAELVIDSDWIWFDIDGLPAYEYWRLQAFGGATALEVRELVFANTPNEIPLAPVNRDDYDTLPNKVFESRPTEFWLDLQRGPPIITLWPVPQGQFTFAQLIVRIQNYIEDVGTLMQEVAVPQKSYMGILCQLSYDYAIQDKDVDVTIIPSLKIDADNGMGNLWDGQSDKANTRITPNIRGYTA